MKVLLGTFACLPACDQYLIAGFRNAGLGYSNLNAKLVKKLFDFSREHLIELRSSKHPSEIKEERTIRL
jgi:hypothetical protein